MAVQEVAPQFRASDGRTYPSRELAERHEELISKREAYERARREFGLALARTQTTADGQPFDFGVTRYYYITPGWADMPQLDEVRFYGFDFEFSDGDELLIYYRSNDRRQEYRISDLYVSRRAAERALLEAQEEWLKERAQDVEELRSRLGAEGGRS